MTKLSLLIICTAFILLCGCQKNDCQTQLQGAWYVAYPNDTNYIVKDSVFFYKADSIVEYYTIKNSPGSYKTFYSSYFITDQCNEIDFNGYNNWDTLKKVLQYNIQQINNNSFQIISKADTGNCSNCVVSFHR